MGNWGTPRKAARATHVKAGKAHTPGNRFSANSAPSAATAALAPQGAAPYAVRGNPFGPTMPSAKVRNHAANIAIAGATGDMRAVGSGAPRGGALCPQCHTQASVQGVCWC